LVPLAAFLRRVAAGFGTCVLGLHTWDEILVEQSLPLSAAETGLSHC